MPILSLPVPSQSPITGLITSPSESGESVGYRTIPGIVAIIVNGPEPILLTDADFIFAGAIPVSDNRYITGLSEEPQIGRLRTIPHIVAVIVNSPEPILFYANFSLARTIPVSDYGVITG